MSSPTPFLDCFRRGEAPRDVKILAAAGALAPRALEQLSLLVLLHDDADLEVRDIARQTLDRIPHDALKAFLGRTDVPIGVREFFGDRGVFPDEIPSISADDPFIDTAPEPDDDPGRPGDPVARESLQQHVKRMGLSDRLKAAMKGSREMRAILIRDPSKMVAAAVLSSPRLTEPEVEGYARIASVSEGVLRIIAANRAWVKNYGIVVALVRNPKTPLALSLSMLNRLSDRDVAAVSIDRNVPEPLRTAARRKTVFGSQR